MIKCFMWKRVLKLEDFISKVRRFNFIFKAARQTVKAVRLEDYKIL